MTIALTVPRRVGGTTISMTGGMQITAPRRGVTFVNPSTISGLQLWLAGDTSTKWQESTRTTPAAADADPVGAWDDLSGNARHLLQAGATARPLLKLAIQNNLPVLRFDGVNDFLNKAFTLVQPEHIFVVARVNARVASEAIFDGLASDSMELRVNAGNTALLDAYAGAFISQTIPNSTSVPMIYSILYNGASSSAYANGTLYGTGSSGATNGSGLTLGARQSGAAAWANVDIAEVLVYSNALSAADRRSVEAYLGNKYAITVV